MRNIWKKLSQHTLSPAGCASCLLIKLHSRFLALKRTWAFLWKSLVLIVNFMHSENFHFPALGIVKKNERINTLVHPFLFCIYSNYKKNVRNVKQTSLLRVLRSLDPDWRQLKTTPMMINQRQCQAFNQPSLSALPSKLGRDCVEGRLWSGNSCAW